MDVEAERLQNVSEVVETAAVVVVEVPDDPVINEQRPPMSLFESIFNNDEGEEEEV